MSESEILDTKPDCSEEPAQLESKDDDDEEGICPPEPGQCEIKEEEDGNSSSGECDSPEPVLKDDDKIPDEIVSKKENCALLRPMDGELDYEEEVDEDKEKKEVILDKKDDGELDEKDEDELDDEDNQKKDKIASEKESKRTNDGEKEDSMEEGEDEGEISDDDLEEGEVKDASPKPETTRQVCRFYGRGQCFYGNACRFLHLNHNEKGQYNMFAPRYSQGYGYGPANLMGPTNSMMSDRPGPRMDYMSSAPPPAPLQIEPSPVESAWERGLREAKEVRKRSAQMLLVKKANKRKEEEPDFDKKKLNLSIHVNEKNTPDYDKENEFFFSRSYTKRNEGHFKKYEEPCDVYENDRAARDHFRSGRYENFEVRYTREDIPRDRRARERSRGRMSSERERYASKEGRNKDRVKDDRVFDIQMRARAFDYVDPWRRSKTPKARRTRSRSGSYSSVSSYSYSDRSSRSSGSYSRSSSRSSCASSRSPSVMHKRKPSPSVDAGLSPKGGVSRFPMLKKKPPARLAARNSRSRSHLRSQSSLSRSRKRSSSSRSRSATRTHSISRSRSYSRSISMDSVSSASSDSVSRSSSGSESRRNRGHAHVSLLRKNDEKLPLDKLDSRNASSFEREDGNRDHNVREDMYSSEIPADVPPTFPSFQHLLPNSDSKGKSQHKQPIKLTLLNKPASSKATSFPKKELDRTKIIIDTKSDTIKQDIPSFSTGTKRPLSPTLSAAANTKTTVAVPKKSASSRRDELLKQLKAVEDAIARKRAKFC